MTDKNRQFWKTEGARKTFTHPLYGEWLKDIDTRAAVLDFGCGYGRLTVDLQQHGFASLHGYDLSPTLIERARKEHPGATYTDDFTSLEESRFGLVTCFAVFTCCPTGSEQLEIIKKIESVTQTGARFYISDYEMVDNPHYQQRYQQRELGIEGCFTSGDACFRHHAPGHFEGLLKHWRLVSERSQQSQTMNGNSITIHQYLFSRI